MPRPKDIAQRASAESRSKGGRARAAKIRAEKEAAREAALGRVAELVDKALDRLEVSLDADDERLALQAARDVLDRVLGRPTQALAVEPFPLKIDLTVLTDEELDELKRILVKAKP